VHGGEILSHCGTGGCLAGRECMLDVDTFAERDRCRGYATAVGAAFIADALERGEDPLWEARLDNAASRRVAEKLGFVDGEAYPVFTVALA
jgi:hypothetical protein